MLKYAFLTLLTLLAFCSNTIAGSLDNYKQALDIISDFANKMCSSVPLEGSGNSVELSGEAKAELRGIIKKLAKMGFEGAGKYQGKEYSGFLQNDLVEALKNTTECKLKIWNDLKDKLLKEEGAKDATFKKPNDNKMQSLDRIAKFANDVCPEVPTTGAATMLTKVKLTKLICDISELGIDGAIKYKSSEYEGLLRKDLKEIISKSLDCRKDLSDKLIDKLIPSSKWTPWGLVGGGTLALGAVALVIGNDGDSGGSGVQSPAQDSEIEGTWRYALYNPSSDNNAAEGTIIFTPETTNTGSFNQNDEINYVTYNGSYAKQDSSVELTGSMYILTGGFDETKENIEGTWYRVDDSTVGGTFWICRNC
jgi:hypothetical protein